MRSSASSSTAARPRRWATTSSTIRRAADRLEAEFLRRLDRFDRAHGALADGAGSTASWVRDHCALTWKAGASRVRLARTLGELPGQRSTAPGPGAPPWAT